MLVLLSYCAFWNSCPCATLLCLSLYSMLLLLNSTMVSFFLFYILGIGSYFFLVPALFLLLHSFFHTLYTVLLLSLPFLLLPLSSSILPGKGYTICFLLVFQEETLVPDFYGFKPPCFYISHTLYRLLLSPL